MPNQGISGSKRDSDITQINIWCQDTEYSNIGRTFGNKLGSKSKGNYCHTFLNVGNFSTDRLSNNKTNDLFSIVRKYDIDSLGFSKHGLNPRGLIPSQSWSLGANGQLKKYRSHIAWNSKWQHTKPRMWGSMGYISHGNSNNRFIGTHDEPDGLGRWTSVSLRGAEGTICEN